MKKLSVKRLPYNYLILLTLLIIHPHIIYLVSSAYGFITTDRTWIYLFFTVVLIGLVASKNRIYTLYLLIIYFLIVFVDFSLVVQKSFFIRFIAIILNSTHIIDAFSAGTSGIDKEIVYIFLIILCSLVIYFISFFVLLFFCRRAFDYKCSKSYIRVALLLGMVLFIPYAFMQNDDFSLKDDQRSLSEGSSIPSAFVQSNWIEKIDGRKNYVLIIVESLGKFIDPNHANAVFSPLSSDSIKKKYTLSFGSLPFSGNTPWGEIRELCGIYSDFSFLQNKLHEPSCIPAKFKNKGYDTIALGGYFNDIFGNKIVYERIGFNRVLIGSDLISYSKNSIKNCSNPLFKGACDVDVLPTIVNLLKENKKPKFLYFLTVNSHQPIISQNIAPHTFHCGSSDRIASTLEVCWTMEIWSDFFSHLAKAIEQIDNTEILVVGDHAPPFLFRDSRKYFSDTETTWIRLSPKQ